MGNYGLILYHRPLCRRCARIRRTLRDLGAEVEVELRSIAFSRRHREELRNVAGQMRVPCLVIAATALCEVEEIEKYLRLRYGDR
jgi:glutathione S-transferase